MRRSAFLSAAALAACAGRRSRAPVAAGGPPVRIVVFGDSLALGVGASRPDRGFIFAAYRAALRARPGSRIDSVASGGATAADVLRTQVSRVRAPADVAIVCVGGNDVVRRTDPARFRAQAGAIAAGIGATLPRARLLLCGVPDVALSPLFGGLDADEIGTLAREDDAAMRAVARAHRATFFDLYAVTNRARTDAARFLSEDRFHPSDRGYALVTAAFAPVLLRALT